MSKAPHVAAHKHSGNNQTELLASETCGCFYCLAIFAPSEIRKWLSYGDESKTAACPRCGIDSVIGSASGYPISHEFLAAMKRHWFGA